MTMISHLQNGLRPTDSESINWLASQNYVGSDGALTEMGLLWAKDNGIPVVEHTTMTLLSPLYSSKGKRFERDTEVVVLWIEKQAICTVVFPDGGIGYVYDPSRRRKTQHIIRPHLEA